MKKLNLIALLACSTTFFMYCTKTDQVIGRRTATPPPSESSTDLNQQPHLQFFAGNYQYTIPTYNSFYGHNDYKRGQFVIGFNISRLWNF